VLLLPLLFLTPSVQADELYFMAVFGAQRGRTQPAYAHTFATFVKLTGEGPCLDTYQIESHTISWLPTRLVVELMCLSPEAGTNFDLPTSLQIAYTQGATVTMFGPFQIKAELYDRALEHIDRLESGKIRYKAIDTGFRTAVASNCIHAVSDLTVNRPCLRVASPGWGVFASHLVALRLRPWVICPKQTHEWLSERLGLCAYPIQHRELMRNGWNPLGFGLLPLPLRGLCY
jgi:hypothetical protein